MRYCLLLAAAILFVTSCSKTEEVKTKEDSLRQGNWRMTRILKTSRINDTSLFVDTLKIEGLPECRQDDNLTFLSNNAGILKTGDKKCQGQTDEIRFNWGLTENDAKMYIYNAGLMFEGNNDISASLSKFSDNEIELQYTTFNRTLYTWPTGTKEYVTDTFWYTTTVRKN